MLVVKYSADIDFVINGLVVGRLVCLMLVVPCEI